jgi:hypothetical protein
MRRIGIEESRLRYYPICEDADVHRVLAPSHKASAAQVVAREFEEPL